MCNSWGPSLPTQQSSIVIRLGLVVQLPFIAFPSTLSLPSSSPLSLISSLLSDIFDLRLKIRDEGLTELADLGLPHPVAPVAEGLELHAVLLEHL